jgi:hypothetical protein
MLAIASILAWASSACGSSAYVREHDAWTRTERIYHNFETRAIVRATLKTRAFRRAWVDEYARLFALGAEQKAALAESDAAEAAERVVVVVSFYTQEQRWNVLNPTDGFWEVRLETPGGDWARPLAVKRLDPRNPLWFRLFPEHDTFSVLYQLEFESAGVGGTALLTEGQPVTLVIAGAPAQIRLTWEPR